jgi:FtsP/CotA-like multicopper oxidase with cupredoxin domain
MPIARCFILFCLFCVVAAAVPTAFFGRDAGEDIPEIKANDNRLPCGRLKDGVFTIELEARVGVWYPEEGDGPALHVQAFAEAGHSPEIPGPMIRVPEGMEISVDIRNAIPGSTLVIHGLHIRPGSPDDTVQLAPEERRNIRFRASKAGTYYYWATTTGKALPDRYGVDSQLNGALIIDPPGTRADDRVFVIGWWENPELRAMGGDPFTKGRNAIVINGRAWPYTERLTYRVGDSVHWRWINAAQGNHPMHLHGSYYTVDSIGDGERDTLLKSEQRRLVVTELMRAGTTMSLTWAPQQPGNWLFHCHVLAHISPGLRLRPADKEPSFAQHQSHHAMDGMAGLVLGINVLPSRTAPAAKQSDMPLRRLRLVAQLQPGRYGKDPGFAFALQEGSGQAAERSGRIPGPPIVLTRGQPVEITVLNKLPEPTSVHWHAMELESYYDGIAGWSGTPGHIAPMIEPEASFVVTFRPPRAGTFIYHTHLDDIRQLSSGLYGPIIVLDSGQSLDPERDRIMLVSVKGPSDNTPILLNGDAEPGPIELKQGVRYRFRFINITPHDPLLTVSLLAGSSPVMWRAIAKDGADLPISQATERPARQTVSVGETYDFEFEPRSAVELWLEVFRPARAAMAQSQIVVPVHVH